MGESRRRDHRFVLHLGELVREVAENLDRMLDVEDDEVIGGKGHLTLLRGGAA